MKLARVCFALLTVVGCSDSTGPDSLFGPLYSIEDEPVPPFLAARTLVVTVQYGGCAGGHEFEVRYRTVASTIVSIWLHKLTPDQPCDMLVTERRSFAVPGQMSFAGSVILLGPDDFAATLIPADELR